MADSSEESLQMSALAEYWVRDQWKDALGKIVNDNGLATNN
jgi:hypothetical protein